MERKRWQLNTNHNDIKTDENGGPHFGVSSEKGSPTRCAPMETKPANKLIRITTENQKRFKVCLCSLSPRDMLFLFVQLMLSTKLSCNDNLKSVIANKLLCYWTKTEFWVFVTFSHSEVTTASNYHLRCNDTRINPFAMWWYSSSTQYQTTYAYINIYILQHDIYNTQRYEFTQPLHHDQDETQGQF